MKNQEETLSLAREVLKQRFENHREYVARQWQYFAVYVLLSGLLINAVGVLQSVRPLLMAAIVLPLIINSAVFFHLIRWTRMHIHRNAERINESAGETIIELPPGRGGIAYWLLFSIMAFTSSWLIWLYQIWPGASLLGLLLFVLMVGWSFVSLRRWRRR